MTLILPWPPRCLFPNSRTDRRASTKTRQNYKLICKEIAKKHIPLLPQGNIHIKLTFYPPDNRRRDLDGMIGAAKYALDGIAMGWNIDDRMFRPLTADVGKPVENGRVEVSI